VKPSRIPSKTAMLLLICALGSLSGCGTRVILVPPGDPVQIRTPVKADVWVFDKNSARVPSTAEIPAGWWALPDLEPKK